MSHSAADGYLVLPFSGRESRLKSMNLAILIAAAISIFVQTSGALTLPAGTNLEVRMSTVTGSRISHPGDPVSATIIAPIVHQNRLLFSQGGTLYGSVERVNSVGFGLKYRTASIAYRFDSLRLTDGRSLPVKTVVREVETAKERVNENGTVGGINPSVSLSSGASLVISALVAEPHIAASILLAKFLIARSPDPEIYFPAGTEMLLQVRDDADLADVPIAPHQVPSLTGEELRNAARLLDGLPQQQADGGPNRPSDLVNVLLLGTRDQIQRAFATAGWSGDGRRSVLALYRMYHCMVQRIGYGTAPMSRLRLNGAAPEFAFQKSLDTFSKRHHIRLWNQQNSDTWLGAATEDVGYTFERMRLTHATDPGIDNERAKVVNDLWLTGCVEAASLLDRDSLKPKVEKGKLPISTDSKIAVLRLNSCTSLESRPSAPNGLEPPPPSRIRQALMAIRTDAARSNLFSLVYYATKASPNQEDQPPSQEHHAASWLTGDSVETTTQEKFRRRASVIDAFDDTAGERLTSSQSFVDPVD